MPTTSSDNPDAVDTDHQQAPSRWQQIRDKGRARQLASANAKRARRAQRAQEKLDRRQDRKEFRARERKRLKTLRKLGTFAEMHAQVAKDKAQSEQLRKFKERNIQEAKHNDKAIIEEEDIVGILNGSKDLLQTYWDVWNRMFCWYSREPGMIEFWKLQRLREFIEGQSFILIVAGLIILLLIYAYLRFGKSLKYVIDPEAKLPNGIDMGRFTNS